MSDSEVAVTNQLALQYDNPLELFAEEEASQDLFWTAEDRTHHDHAKNTRGRTSDGGLSIAWRAPDWALPSLPSDLELAPFAPLERMKDRNACLVCGKSRHYFCYNCLQVLTPLDETPRLELPFKVHLLMHRNERWSMSTGLHAALLAPEHVRVHGWEEPLPSFDPASTLLLFPSKQSVPVELVDKEKIRSIVVLESKWKGTAQLLDLPEVRALPHVRLSQGRTSYWRYHTKGVPSYALSTIEAIWELCRAWHPDKHGGDPTLCRCFDNLLWYFAFLHGLIACEAALSSP